MIKRRYPTLTRTAKKFGLTLVLLLFYLLYEYQYGYINFDVEDIRQPAAFTFKKAKNAHYTIIVVRVKGEIKGRARIKVDYCDNLKSTSYWYTPRINLIITGKVDTVMKAENYSGQACIEYKPRNVDSGELSIAVSAR
jgi:hypothetical protein